MITGNFKYALIDFEFDRITVWNDESLIMYGRTKSSSFMRDIHIDVVDDKYVIEGYEDQWLHSNDRKYIDDIKDKRIAAHIDKGDIHKDWRNREYVIGDFRCNRHLKVKKVIDANYFSMSFIENAE